MAEIVNNPVVVQVFSLEWKATKKSASKGTVKETQEDEKTGRTLYQLFPKSWCITDQAAVVEIQRLETAAERI